MRERGVEFEERDLAKKPLSVAELDALIGDRSALDFLSTRNEVYRERNLKANPPDRDGAIALLAEHVNLLRRPLLVIGDMILFGFSAAEYEAALK